MKKNFENFKEFLKNLRVSFSAICLSETWCESQKESQNSNYILSGYNFFHQHRQYRRGGVVSFYERIVLSINCDAIESLCLVITNEKSKIIQLTPGNSNLKGTKGNSST